MCDLHNFVRSVIHKHVQAMITSHTKLCLLKGSIIIYIYIYIYIIIIIFILIDKAKKIIVGSAASHYGLN